MHPEDLNHNLDYSTTATKYTRYSLVSNTRTKSGFGIFNYESPQTSIYLPRIIHHGVSVSVLEKYQATTKWFGQSSSRRRRRDFRAENWNYFATGCLSVQGRQGWRWCWICICRKNQVCDGNLRFPPAKKKTQSQRSRRCAAKDHGVGDKKWDWDLLVQWSSAIKWEKKGKRRNSI